MAGEFNALRVNYPVRSDKMTESLSMMMYEHHEIHEGNAFHAHFYSGTVNTDGTVQMLLTTPDTTRWPHAIAVINATKGALFELYEEPTITDNGALVTAYNRNRNSNTSANLAVHSTPTVSNDGTRIWLRHTGSAGKYSNPGETRGANEWILKQDTQYLIKATSHEDSNELMVGLNWYEHTNNHN